MESNNILIQKFNNIILLKSLIKNNIDLASEFVYFYNKNNNNVITENVLNNILDDEISIYSQNNKDLDRMLSISNVILEIENKNSVEKSLLSKEVENALEITDRKTKLSKLKDVLSFSNEIASIINKERNFLIKNEFIDNVDNFLIDKGFLSLDKSTIKIDLINGFNNSLIKDLSPYCYNNTVLQTQLSKKTEKTISNNEYISNSNLDRRDDSLIPDYIFANMELQKVFLSKVLVEDDITSIKSSIIEKNENDLLFGGQIFIKKMKNETIESEIEIDDELVSVMEILLDTTIEKERLMTGLENSVYSLTDFIYKNDKLIDVNFINKEPKTSVEFIANNTASKVILNQLNQQFGKIRIYYVERLNEEKLKEYINQTRELDYIDINIFDEYTCDIKISQSLENKYPNLKNDIDKSTNLAFTPKELLNHWSILDKDREGLLSAAFKNQVVYNDFFNKTKELVNEIHNFNDLIEKESELIIKYQSKTKPFMEEVKVYNDLIKELTKLEKKELKTEKGKLKKEEDIKELKSKIDNYLKTYDNALLQIKNLKNEILNKSNFSNHSNPEISSKFKFLLENIPDEIIGRKVSEKEQALINFMIKTQKFIASKQGKEFFDLIENRIKLNQSVAHNDRRWEWRNEAIKSKIEKDTNKPYNMIINNEIKKCFEKIKENKIKTLGIPEIGDVDLNPLNIVRLDINDYKKPKMYKETMVIDIETSGVSEEDGVSQISIIMINSNPETNVAQEVIVYDSKINPEVRLVPYIEEEYNDLLNTGRIKLEDEVFNEKTKKYEFVLGYEKIKSVEGVKLNPIFSGESFFKFRAKNQNKSLYDSTGKNKIVLRPTQEKGAIEVHKLTNEELENKPSIVVYSQKLINMLSNADSVITYNGRKFDLPFIEQTLKKYDITIPNIDYKHLDIIEVSRDIVLPPIIRKYNDEEKLINFITKNNITFSPKSNYTLDQMVKTFGINNIRESVDENNKIISTHDAVYDIILTYQLGLSQKKYLEKISEKELDFDNTDTDKKIDDLVKQLSVPLDEIRCENIKNMKSIDFEYLISSINNNKIISLSDKNNNIVVNKKDNLKPQFG